MQTPNKKKTYHEHFLFSVNVKKFKQIKTTKIIFTVIRYADGNDKALSI